MLRRNLRSVMASGNVLALIGAVASLFAADQPQWAERFSRNSVSQERGLAVDFDPQSNRNVRWSAALGTVTHGTPVIAAGRVYIGTNNHAPRDQRHQGDRGVLMCFDEASGRLLWQLVVPKITTSRFWDWPGAGLCSPPTVEEGVVYVVSNRGEVLALDPAGLANGNQGPYLDESRHQTPEGEAVVPLGPTDADILWRFDLIGELGVRQHDSAHASILAHAGFLYVNTSNGVDDSHRRIAAPDAPSLVVLERSTGRLVAADGERIGPRIFHCTWSSPALVERDGRPLIVFCGGDGVVYGFEALTAAPPAGKVTSLKKEWQFDLDPTGPKEEVHRYNGNRRISPSNIAGLPVVHGGRLYVAGGGDLWWGKNEAWLKCLELPTPTGAAAPREVWTYPLIRHVMSSSAVQDGLVYVADTGRRIHCVDTATGQARWTHDVKGEVWATPLIADGRVYVVTRQGEFLVFAHGREKQLLGTAQLDGPVSGSPVAANGVLYVTTMNRLYAVRDEVKRVAVKQ
jgi:outer membrane protein assembly factor BamB